MGSGAPAAAITHRHYTCGGCACSARVCPRRGCDAQTEAPTDARCGNSGSCECGGRSRAEIGLRPCSVVWRCVVSRRPSHATPPVAAVTEPSACEEREGRRGPRRTRGKAPH